MKRKMAEPGPKHTSDLVAVGSCGCASLARMGIRNLPSTPTRRWRRGMPRRRRPAGSSAGDAAGQIGDRPLELVAASGRGRLLSLGVEGPYPDVAVTSAADAALLGDDQVTLSTRVLIPPVSLPDAAHASLGATSDGARPPGHPSNILLELQSRQLNGGALSV